MTAKRQSIALFYGKRVCYSKVGEKSLYHRECLCVADYRCIGIEFQKLRNTCRMVRLHMLNHQIIRLSVAKLRFYLFKPYCRKVYIDSIHNRRLFVKNDIRVVGNAVRHFVLTFKKVDRGVVYTDIFYVF